MWLSNAKSLWAIYINTIMRTKFPNVVYTPDQVKLRLAAKARLMRMVKPHTKRKTLEAPEWVKKEWETGNKNKIADLLCECNFDQDSQRAKAHGCLYYVVFVSSLVLLFPMIMIKMNFDSLKSRRICLKTSLKS